MRVAESDDELDADYDMLDSDLDEDELKKSTSTGVSPASTAPSTPFLNPSGKLPRRRQKIHECTFEDCDRVFDRKARLEDHLRSHNKERNFKCPHSPCTKTFLRDSHLKHHVKNQHTQERDHKCEWDGCDASFTTGTRLRRHIATHEAREQFRCHGYSGCDQTFRKQETLDRHIKTVHQGVRAFPCEELDPTTGAPCNKAYDTAENLRTHVRAKHDTTRFSCDECVALNEALLLDPEKQGDTQTRPAQFATYALLQAHNAEYHPPMCDFCPTSFVTAKELTRHLELQHGVLPEKKTKNATVFNCTFEGCGKKFTKRGNLNVHVKTVHENKRDFVCGKTLVPLPSDAVDRGDVVVHGCGRGFTSKASLEEHVRTAHLELPSKRMIREKKRKASMPFEEAQPKKPKQRKTRSDKGVPRGSALNGLTGLGEPTTPVVEDGPFPFGFGDDTFAQTEMEDQLQPVPSAATRFRSGTGDSLFGDNPTFLSDSMTICEDVIYSQGTAYHYPSGEYPTLLSRRLARTTVHDDEDLSAGHIFTSPSHNLPIDDYDDVNFFGYFEQESSVNGSNPKYMYPAL
ncbi:hypothetical protein H2200_001570 [Cladophialophora chaetospira]|uniref:C2H2-type domain-containing protein n=1 Tax=Cladophialophora chaetospira TaxID=386627 RepID=A0AA38XLE5_9EURO|nr:hypothetical protein H2200_001570 [Cladophialophora chaetospira]